MRSVLRADLKGSVVKEITGHRERPSHGKINCQSKSYYKNMNTFTPQNIKTEPTDIILKLYSKLVGVINHLPYGFEPLIHKCV